MHSSGKLKLTATPFGDPSPFHKFFLLLVFSFCFCFFETRLSVVQDDFELLVLPPHPTPQRWDHSCVSYLALLTSVLSD